MPSFLDWSAWLALGQEAAKPMGGGAAAPMPADAGGAAAPAAGGGAAAPGVAPGNGGILEFIFANPAILMLILVGLFYFTIVRPQQSRQSEHDKMLSDLKVNDRVFTIGGILGTIVNIDKEEGTISLRIDDKSGTRIDVLRSYIGGLEKDADEEEKKDS